MGKNLKVSDPKALMGLSVFLILIGGMVIDPLAGLICFILAGILMSIACIKGAGWLRYIAIVLLIIIIALAVSKFPEAKQHQNAYRSRAVTEGVK
jgi:hypothetical protein